MDFLAGIMLWMESLGRIEMTATEQDTKATHLACDSIQYSVEHRTGGDNFYPPFDSSPKTN